MLSRGVLFIYLIVMAGLDVKYRRISLRISLAVFIFLAFWRIVEICHVGETLPSAFLGVLTGIFLWFISYVSKGEIGAGDGLVFVIMGLVLSLRENFVVLLMALTFSGVLGGSLLMLKRIQRREKIPFVPFVLCGYGVMLLWKILDLS